MRNWWVSWGVESREPKRGSSGAYYYCCWRRKKKKPFPLNSQAHVSKTPLPNFWSTCNAIVPPPPSSLDSLVRGSPKPPLLAVVNNTHCRGEEERGPKRPVPLLCPHPAVAQQAKEICWTSYEYLSDSESAGDEMGPRGVQFVVELWKICISSKQGSTGLLENNRRQICIPLPSPPPPPPDAVCSAAEDWMHA
jgi:hypothetical protein